MMPNHQAMPDLQGQDMRSCYLKKMNLKHKKIFRAEQQIRITTIKVLFYQNFNRKRGRISHLNRNHIFFSPSIQKKRSNLSLQI